MYKFKADQQGPLKNRDGLRRSKNSLTINIWGRGGVLPVDYDVTKLDNSYMYLSCTDFYQTLI